MKPQDQIIALANLDGWTLKLEKGTDVENYDEPWEEYRWISGEGWLSHDDIPTYLTNGDEMRRLIGKVCMVPTAVGTAELRADFIAHLANIIGVCKPPKNQYFELVLAKPLQLSEALLRAHGLWKD